MRQSGADGLDIGGGDVHGLDLELGELGKGLEMRDDFGAEASFGEFERFQGLELGQKFQRGFIKADRRILPPLRQPLTDPQPRELGELQKVRIARLCLRRVPSAEFLQLC